MRLVAEFSDRDAAVTAAEAAHRAGFTLADAMSPFPVEEFAALLPRTAHSLRGPMAIAGSGTAASFYLLEWWSATQAYPFDSGGRPFNSWPIFILAPFEVGILAAAVVGFAAFLIGSTLTRLHHPAFAFEATTRATQASLVLVFENPSDPDQAGRLRDLLVQAGARDFETRDGVW